MRCEISVARCTAPLQVQNGAWFRPFEPILPPAGALTHCKSRANLYNPFATQHRCRRFRHGGNRRRHRIRGTHARRLLQRGLRGDAGEPARNGGAQGSDGARQGVTGGGRGNNPRPDPDGRPGPEPGPPGIGRSRDSLREPGLGRQPAVRFGASGGGARLSADRRRRCAHRRCGRPGIHEHGASLPAPAERREDGRLRR